MACHNLLLVQLLEKKFNGVWAARLTVMFKEKYGKDLPFRTLGYDSTIDFFKDENSFWRAEQPIVNGDCIVFPIEPYEGERMCHWICMHLFLCPYVCLVQPTLCPHILLCR